MPEQYARALSQSKDVEDPKPGMVNWKEVCDGVAGHDSEPSGLSLPGGRR